MRDNTFFFKSVFDFFEDCLYLPGALAAAYHKIIGEAAHLTGIQQDYIGCLLVAGNFYSFMSYFQ
jgi:hypothetical protein